MRSVEFFGSPGSGKSSIAEALRPFPEFRGTNSLHRGPNAASTGIRRFRVAMAQRRAIAAGLRLLAGTRRSVNEYAFAVRLLGVTLDIASERGSASQEKVVVLDEGCVQRVFLLGVDASGGPDADLALAFVKAAPVADMLVHVRATPRECVSRLGSRGRGLPPRLARLPAGEVERVLATADRVMRDVAHEVGSRLGGPQVISVDSSTGTPAQLAAKVRSAVIS